MDSWIMFFLNAFYKTLINKMVHCPAVSCTISLYAYNCVMFKSRSSQPYPCPQRLICLRWKYLNPLFQLSFVRKASVALRVAVVMSMCERWDFTFLHKDNLVPLLNHSPPPPPHVLSRFWKPTFHLSFCKINILSFYMWMSSHDTHLLALVSARLVTSNPAILLQITRFHHFMPVNERFLSPSLCRSLLQIWLSNKYM